MNSPLELYKKRLFYIILHVQNFVQIRCTSYEDC